MQALLVSRDADAVSVLQSVMHELDVESEVCAELQPAVERLAEGATSAVVVDYDVEHASELLKLMRQNYAGSCVALAMVKGLASIQAAYDMGANFVLIKPVSAAAASCSLAEATALVERMTHRPARLLVPTLAYVNFEGGLDPAIILDISERGMAIQALQPVHAEGPLRLRFDLPGTSETMSLTSEIMWADSSGRAGLRFLDLSQEEQQRLWDWVRINGSSLQPAAKPEERAPAPAPAPVPFRTFVIEPSPPVALPPAFTATVAQRLFSALVDTTLVLLATVMFFGTFLVFAGHLPASRWALPIALAVPFVFWVVYLCVFLAHPRGTPGTQMAENGIAVAAADRPEMFAVVPPSPLVSASSRVLTWLEARCGGDPRIHPDAMATHARSITSGAAESVRRDSRLHHS
ncbi:MAG: PilZ domain-containing protein [Terriglobales bacterium]